MRNTETRASKLPTVLVGLCLASRSASVCAATAHRPGYRARRTVIPI